MYSTTLSFYGINVLINSGVEQLIEDIRRDFSFFKREINNPQITINAYNSAPPYHSLPPMQASYLSPRNACFYNKKIKYVDYSGSGLVIYDKAKSKCDVYSKGYPLLHEICFMSILSLVNEKLEKLHIHRIHGLGLSIENKAILILLDVGGGKTTLAMDILAKDNKIKLISEDSPLINSNGQILPFPIRIGVHPESVLPQIPKEYQRYYEREEFDSKILIDIEYFKDKICHYPCEPYIVILGRRVLGRQPEIKPTSKYEAIKESVKNSVIGLGLYQGIEFIFQKSTLEVVKKMPLAALRFNNALKVINKSKIFEIFLSPDREKNSSFLVNFLFKNL